MSSNACFFLPSFLNSSEEQGGGRNTGKRSQGMEAVVWATPAGARRAQV